MSYDGVVSRHLNRRLSRPLSAALAPTPLSPNLVTFATLGLSFGVAVMIAVGWNIAGGIGIQVVSVVDGVDGELARLKGVSTRFGAALDAIADRYADAAMLGAMTIYAARFEDWPRPEVVGALALAGALTVSYSRARIEASMEVAPSDGLFGFASRDVRLLGAAIGTAVGQCYWTLAVVAVASGLTIAWRLLALRFWPAPRVGP